MPDPGDAPPCGCQTGRRSETAPDSAAARGEFEILRAEVHAAPNYTERHQRCRACGRSYRVTDDQGYWKTLYTWEPVEAD